MRRTNTVGKEPVVYVCRLRLLHSPPAPIGAPRLQGSYFRLANVVHYHH